MSKMKRGLGIQRNRKQEKSSNSLTHPSRTLVNDPAHLVQSHDAPAGSTPSPHAGLCSSWVVYLECPSPSSLLQKCPSSFQTSSGVESIFLIGWYDQEGTHPSGFYLATNQLSTVPSHFRHFWLFTTPWSVARQSSLSMGFNFQLLNLEWPVLSTRPVKEQVLKSVHSLKRH